MCGFEDFGESMGMYINETTVMCVTPHIQGRPSIEHNMLARVVTMSPLPGRASEARADGSNDQIQNMLFLSKIFLKIQKKVNT